MQVDGAASGVGTIPRRGRLEVLLAIAAIVVIAAVVALLVWVVPLTTSGVEDAIPKAGAGSAVIHDDAGSMLPEAGVVPAAIHDDAGNMPLSAGSAIVHDDAGNLKSH